MTTKIASPSKKRVFPEPFSIESNSNSGNQRDSGDGPWTSRRDWAEEEERDERVRRTLEYEARYSRDTRRFIPYGTIAFGLALLFTGIILLSLASVNLNGNWIPLLILGLVTFLPGSYVSTIAWGSYRKWKGYSFDQLPASYEMMM